VLLSGEKGGIKGTRFNTSKPSDSQIIVIKKRLIFEV
jgi:hypothetical protein